MTCSGPTYMNGGRGRAEKSLPFHDISLVEEWHSFGMQCMMETCVYH